MGAATAVNDVSSMLEGNDNTGQSSRLSASAERFGVMREDVLETIVQVVSLVQSMSWSEGIKTRL